ncbi:MAG: alpha/beta fold hydrolase [Balneolaceae bacterium]|nr:alpha/beta fold hydrolase [Balneolaceae bacterium]
MQSSLRDPVPFRPAAWCRGGHAQTIASSLLGDTSKPPHRRVEIPTPDDDFLELDLAGEENEGPCVVLFHGLEGSSDRYYMASMMRALATEGFAACAVNFRSCGSRMNRRPRFYHSGETDDYRTVFEWADRHFPGRRLTAVGFSLGANALLKYLGEEGGETPLYAAAAVSAPYDLKLGSLALSRGFNRLYEQLFLRTLRQKLARKREHHPELPSFEGTTLYGFDHKVTAPVHGFNGAEDYYYTCSARRFLEDIRTPSLLVHSREDPICPVEALPMQKILANPDLDYLLTDSGGHVGFRGKYGNWLSHTLLRFLAGRL